MRVLHYGAFPTSEIRNWKNFAHRDGLGTLVLYVLITHDVTYGLQTVPHHVHPYVQQSTVVENNYFLIIFIFFNNATMATIPDHLRPSPPSIALFIPAPTNTYVTTCTFIRFKSCKANRVGLVVSIDACRSILTVQHFLSWEQMLEVVDGNAMANVSFWPTTQNSSTPHYLCDSDITSTVTSDDVLGLAFVFYASDPVVAQLNGMANTFQVSSFFDTCKMIVTHDWTFAPFSSQASMIPTCYPSNLFSQILTIKNKLHQIMNSWSMNAQNYTTIQVDCIDPYT